MKSICDRFKEIRTELNLTQSEIGAFLGLSQTQIASIETGKSNPTVETLKKLSEVGINEAWLIREAGLKYDMSYEEWKTYNEEFMRGENPHTETAEAKQWARQEILCAIGKNPPILLKERILLRKMFPPSTIQRAIDEIDGHYLTVLRSWKNNPGVRALFDKLLETQDDEEFQMMASNVLLLIKGERIREAKK
jgi:transcriptional regulator with XRE-family HTH domain